MALKLGRKTIVLIISIIITVGIVATILVSHSTYGSQFKNIAGAHYTILRNTSSNGTAKFDILAEKSITSDTAKKIGDTVTQIYGKANDTKVTYNVYFSKATFTENENKTRIAPNKGIFVSYSAIYNKNAKSFNVNMTRYIDKSSNTYTFDKTDYVIENATKSSDASPSVSLDVTSTNTDDASIIDLSNGLTDIVEQENSGVAHVNINIYKTDSDYKNKSIGWTLSSKSPSIIFATQTYNLKISK